MACMRNDVFQVRVRRTRSAPAQTLGGRGRISSFTMLPWWSQGQAVLPPRLHGLAQHTCGLGVDAPEGPFREVAAPWWERGRRGRPWAHHGAFGRLSILFDVSSSAGKPAPMPAPPFSHARSHLLTSPNRLPPAMHRSKAQLQEAEAHRPSCGAALPIEWAPEEQRGAGKRGPSRCLARCCSAPARALGGN